MKDEFGITDAELLGSGDVVLFKSRKGHEFKTKILGIEDADNWCCNHVHPIQAIERDLQKLATDIEAAKDETADKLRDTLIERQADYNRAMRRAVMEYNPDTLGGLLEPEHSVTNAQVISAFMKLLRLTDPTTVGQLLSLRLFNAQILEAKSGVQ